MIQSIDQSRIGLDLGFGVAVAIRIVVVLGLDLWCVGLVVRAHTRAYSSLMYADILRSVA